MTNPNTATPVTNATSNPKSIREDLLAGTRPEIGERIIMTGADGFDGYEIMEYKGMVWGISVRAKDMGQDCAMGCQQLVGGELGSYSQLGNESRQRAIDLMLQMAKRQGANGVINVSFELDGASQGASQVVAHGTAVHIKPIINYVPEGAVGNILAEIQESMVKG
ncbi:MAG: YbjQ family protein [Chloroflexota bacterium]